MIGSRRGICSLPSPDWFLRLAQVVKVLLEPEPSNRPTMDEILALPQIRQRMHLYTKPPSPTPSTYAPSVMLDTIKVPKNFRMLGKRLPEARYPDPPGGMPNTASSWCESDWSG
eukprot:5480813-Pyramimonas_sp.AAC.1